MVLVRKFSSPEPTTSVGAEKSLTVEIKVTGTLFVNQSAKDKLTVTYSNLSSGDVYNITIFKDPNSNCIQDLPGDEVVYTQRDELSGLPEQIIHVNLTPETAGWHCVAANGNHAAFTIADTMPVFLCLRLRQLRLW